MIISFALTPGAIRDGTKTVTRRFWSETHAMKFHAGDIVDAYDRSPRNGGQVIRKIRIIRDPYREPLENMTDEHFKREGGRRFWFDKQEFINVMGGPDAAPFVIEFDYVMNETMEMGL